MAVYHRKEKCHKTFKILSTLSQLVSQRYCLWCLHTVLWFFISCTVGMQDVSAKKGTRFSTDPIELIDETKACFLDLNETGL